MLILFLSLTLPGLDRRLLTNREGDAPPRVKEIREGGRRTTESQGDQGGRETHHRESRRSRRDSGTTAEQPDDPNTHHWPRGKTPLSRFCVFHALPLILYIVFGIALCHYLLSYISIALVFLLISYVAFVTKLCYCLLYSLLCVT